VAARLAEWAQTNGANAGVLCASADLQAAPRIIHERNITSFPAVVLMRGGKVERRADGADVGALERLLEEAGVYSHTATGTEPAAPDKSGLLPRQALAVAEDLEQQGASPATVASWYQQIVEDGSSSALLLAFRARLGLLRCALAEAEAAGPAAPAAADGARAALEALREHHEEELQGELQDAVEVGRLLARAALLADHWEGAAAGEEAEVLRLHAEGKVQEAVAAALAWYQSAAGGDIQGLVASYSSPERRIPERRGEVPSKSVFAGESLALDLDDAPGPAAARAVLCRLFDALGHQHEVVAKARAELEFLLDRKPFVPFFTRRIRARKGGPPLVGRGTGKRSGYSKRYWIMYGPERCIINNRPMGSPHCDKND